MIAIAFAIYPAIIQFNEFCRQVEISLINFFTLRNTILFFIFLLIVICVIVTAIRFVKNLYYRRLRRKNRLSKISDQRHAISRLIEEFDEKKISLEKFVFELENIINHVSKFNELDASREILKIRLMDAKKELAKQEKLNRARIEKYYERQRLEENERKKQLEQDAPREVKINVDEFARFYRKSKLNKDEVKFLLDKHYKIEKRKSIVTEKFEEFLLQPRHNETTTHLFVIYDIAEYLEKNGIEVEKYATRKPDLVFELNGKNFAIEVETGAVLSKIDRMKEKLEVLSQYDKWFFVVTNRNKVKKYKKFGDSVDVRYVKERLNKIIKQAKNREK